MRDLGDRNIYGNPPGKWSVAKLVDKHLLPSGVLPILLVLLALLRLLRLLELLLPPPLGLLVLLCLVAPSTDY